MTEHVANPFTAYNSTGEVRTLVGNWLEEQCLKDVTGTTRKQTHTSVSPAAAQQSVYATRQDDALCEPTHARVIEHTEQLLPAGWVTHNAVNYQPPGACTTDLASYTIARQHGPREEQELRRMLHEAATEAVPAPPPASFETTQWAAFQPHNLVGMQTGARVMKSQDGGPVCRDPTFLAETQIVPKSLGGRIMNSNSSSPNSSIKAGTAVSGHWNSSSQQRCSLSKGEVSVPITIYIDAARKDYTGTFYVSW
eukprot:GHRR01023541.1.p1 GENE.GHRR01023541.1~~GHRR01023541.1.p1  ORF type:complete len:252 (+),score=80.00 GHRR01023541.1:862-1617(+)